VPPPPPKVPPPSSTSQELPLPVINSLLDAEVDRSTWRQQDFAYIANQRIEQVKSNSQGIIEEIRRDIQRAQDIYHQADVEANKYQNQRQRGTLLDGDILADALEQRQRALAELQRQKGRVDKVEAWRSRKIREIWSLQGRAQNGEYNGYRGLKNYDTSYYPNWFK
jgi:hypothetical protein